jgi:branched-chain amino acid transport system permease protein
VKLPVRTWVLLGLLALLAIVPPVANAMNQPFYLDLLRRIMIFAMAAVSLNLILGYGGMVSFGHAAYLGIGAYAVGILAHHAGQNVWLHSLLLSGWLQWPLAIGASALVALVIGAVSVRTSGIYFIMITLAFTQMLYYLGISIEEYGGDDGMRLQTRSQFSGLIDLNDPNSFYYLVLVLLALYLLIAHRIVNSRFGIVLQASRSNEQRTRAIGLSPYPYRLIAFTISGAMCGLAGALLVNHTAYLTPEFMNWTRSGELMFMVILGGIATASGPLLGAAALLLLEDLLQGGGVLPKWVTEHWQLYLGVILVLVVLYAKRGLAGLLPGNERHD